MNIHQLYSKIQFLEKYIPKSFLHESNLLRALNFTDIKMLDKEYILLSFFIWLILFSFFLITYLIIIIIKPDILLNVIAISQLFLAFLILIIYYYPIYLQNKKLSLMKEEFTLFFLHFKILVDSGLNFNQITKYLIKEDLPYRVIQNEFKRIYNFAKFYNISIENAFKKIVSNYPNSFIKEILLELINYQRENKDLKIFANETWKKIKLINEEEEIKFYNKLDFFMDFYSIILLIFPFLLILVTFIFESVNIIFDKMTNSNLQVDPLNTLFSKTIFILLIVLPLLYSILLLIIDKLTPPHLKFTKKLKENI